VEKSKTGLIVTTVVVVAIGAVAYLGLRKNTEVAVPSGAGDQTAVAPAQAPTIQTAKSSEVKKGEVLAFTPGQASGTPNQPPGSWFSLELMKGFSTYIGLQPGSDGGIVIGKAQPASGSHPGASDGKEKTSIDAPWVFFSSTGMHFTTGNGIKFIGSGQLDFSSWRWTWNGIQEIDLGAGKTASFNWSGEPGKPFTLEYQTIIPNNVPGFGGKKYTLHLEGTVKQP
jgi:hypothetical protein